VIDAYLKLIAPADTIVLSAVYCAEIFEGVPKKMRYKLSNYRALIGGVRINKNHWCLLYVNIAKATVFFVDPFLAGIDDEDKALTNWRFVFYLCF
jgi:hypothetical protein